MVLNIEPRVQTYFEISKFSMLMAEDTTLNKFTETKELKILFLKILFTADLNIPSIINCFSQGHNMVIIVKSEQMTA